MEKPTYPDKEKPLVPVIRVDSKSERRPLHFKSTYVWLIIRHNGKEKRIDLREIFGFHFQNYSLPVEKKFEIIRATMPKEVQLKFLPTGAIKIDPGQLGHWIESIKLSFNKAIRAKPKPVHNKPTFIK